MDKQQREAGGRGRKVEKYMNTNQQKRNNYSRFVQQFEGCHVYTVIILRVCLNPAPPVAQI